MSCSQRSTSESEVMDMTQEERGKERGWEGGRERRKEGGRVAGRERGRERVREEESSKRQIIFTRYK